MDADSYPAENSGRLTNSVAENMKDDKQKGVKAWMLR